jgi:hypothetical protein
VAADLEAEASKHAIEGWDSILQAHLGPAGATLVWTTFWAAQVVLLVVFTRYVGVLGAGAAAEGTPERLAYDRLRASLEDGGSPTRVYGRLLTQFLDGVDRFFGDHDKADLGIFRHVFGLRGSYPLWTGAALDRCLFLSLVYPIVSVIVIWAISGHVGLAEAILSLPSDAPGWARGVCLAGIFGLSISISRVWGLGGIWVSGGEAEGLHFVGVLSFGDEFREDGALGGIQEKFWEALA